MTMGEEGRRKSTRNNKRADGKFRSKNVKHDPQAESARAVFGLHHVNRESKDEPR